GRAVDFCDAENRPRRCERLLIRLPSDRQKGRLSRRPFCFMLKPIMLGKTNVFLVGPMGSGKTAVGRYLARLLDLTFYDSDAEIERRTGVDIPFIFEKEGEPGFRQREKEAIEVLTAMDRIVLATGGGAVLLAETRRHLADRGCVVYLETSVTQQVERVKQG